MILRISPCNPASISWRDRLAAAYEAHCARFGIACKRLDVTAGDAVILEVDSDIFADEGGRHRLATAAEDRPGCRLVQDCQVVVDGMLYDRARRMYVLYPYDAAGSSEIKASEVLAGDFSAVLGLPPPTVDL